MARSIDLDSILEEANGDPVVMQFGGREVSLPSDLPLRFGTKLGDGDTLAAIQVLVGDDEGQKIFDELGTKSLEQFLKALTDMYLTSEGESSASPDSSQNDGPSSRPTSGASTTSASRKPVTAVKDSA